MTPSIREALRQHLIVEEGCVLHAYPDSLGYWTIGVGRLIDRRRGGGISRMEALHLLDNDIDNTLAGLIAALPWFHELDDVRQLVLCAMAFQLGLAGTLKFTRTLAAIQRGDYRAAAHGMCASKWAQQTPARVDRMARMMETGMLP